MGSDKEPGSARGPNGNIILRLRLSSLGTLIFVGLAAVVLAYVAGVMSGRHQLSSFTENVEPAPVKIVEEAAPQPQDVILTPEQLEFARVLRGEAKSPPQETPLPEATPAPEMAQPTPEQHEVQVKQDAGDLFDYVFQIAAFRDENSADGLRQKLEGYGLRTALERKGKLFIVLVRMRATAQRAAELAEMAARLKLGEPLVKSRKPAVP